MSVDWTTYRCLLNMARFDDWASKYLQSDHHVDRVAFAKIDYRDKKGIVYLEPPERGRSNMARGRGRSFDTGSLIISTRRRQTSPEYDPFGASSKAYRISHIADCDASDLSKRSRDRDRRLLSDITQRLNRIEYDGVKPGKDVTSKTGFRRMLYNRTYVPVEKETREKRRKDELRYPWDNTISVNVFRGVKQRPKTNKRLPKKKDKTDNDKSTKEYSELPEDLPEYDPMGVYRPRPKRQHKAYEDYSLAGKKYETMDVRAMLANVRAKVEAMPRQRSSQQDIDSFLSDIMRPLPKNDMKDLQVFTIDAYPEYDAEAKREGLDDHLKKKIKASQDDLEEFERMLNNRYSARKSLRVPSRVSAALKTRSCASESDERELELGLEPTFDEPMVIHRHPRPVIRAAPSPIRHRAAVPVHASPRVRVRSSSVPASARVAPRGRSRIADIEAYYREWDPDWSYVPVRPYAPAYISLSSSQFRPSLRTRSASLDRARPLRVVTSYEPIEPIRTRYQPVKPVARGRKRMPQLDPYRPSMGSMGDVSTASVAPYKPVDRVRPNPVKLSVPTRGSFRPHVSETRRRIRDVICSSRKDPHYFD